MPIIESQTVESQLLGERLRTEAAVIARSASHSALRHMNQMRQQSPSPATELSPLRKLASWAWSVRLARATRVAAEEANMRLSAQASLIADLREQVGALSDRTQQFAQLATDYAELQQQVGALRREIMFQQRRLTKEVGVASLAQPGADPGLADDRLDSLYAAFEDVFRGSHEDIKQRLQGYLDDLKVAGVGGSGKPVLDIGCGRGEWLELLRDNKIEAYGIDSNSAMVERVRALGLDARRDDLLAHLNGLPNESLIGVTAFHVVEHLEFRMLVDALDEILRVLAPGGVLILETPNPETIRVGATTFYNDPTHRNPIPPKVLQFIVSHRGFENVDVVRMHPFTEGLLSAGTPDAQMLNRLLFGPQDYAVIARRG